MPKAEILILVIDLISFDNGYFQTGQTTPTVLLSSQPPPEFWCSIAYFELDQQVCK